MEFGWEYNWAWGLSLTAFTIAVHALGVVSIAFWLERVRAAVLGRQRSRTRDIATAATVVGVVGLLLAVLHCIESAIWAAVYLRLEAVPSPREAILYSLDSMTTRGASGVQLDVHWQLMGALEAANGMIVFGVSTAFVFAVLQRVLPLLGLHVAGDQ